MGELSHEWIENDLNELTKHGNPELQNREHILYDVLCV